MEHAIDYRDEEIAETEIDAKEPKYFKLEQHKRSKEIYDKFNSNVKYADCTLAEREHFDGIYPSIEYYLFFDKAPTQFNNYYTAINHNIRTYNLYQLSNSGEISITAFDSSAALSELKISATEKVLCPTVGTFVISFTHEDKPVDIILDIRKHPHSYEWVFFTHDGFEYAEFDKIFRTTLDSNNYYTGQVFDQNGEFLELPDVGFDDIFLDPVLREEVRKNIIEYIDPVSVELKKKNNIPTKRGVIFAGAPGTGKTFLSRALANHLDATFMVISSITHINDIRNAFDFAKKFKRIILLFEDIDIYIKNRDFGSDLLPAMLNKLDGIEVNNGIVVLCTTNKVDAMDKALKDRPGRFDRILKFEAPSIELKAEMLKGFCKGKENGGIDYGAVAKIIPEKNTGAHIKEIYITACNEAIDNHEVNSEDMIVLTTERLKHAVDSVKNRKELSRIGFGGGNK